MVLAGIVLFNPDIERLKENIKSILPQVDEVLCIDNGSDNISDIKANLPKCVKYIENTNNKGIATALNQILFYAKSNGFDWFISLDQDSVCNEGLIEEYMRNIELPSAAILTCIIVDRNFVAGMKYHSMEMPVEIDQCITSASFYNTRIIDLVGGFDEKMFIDSVDFDICVNLRNHGYKIYRIKFVGLLHEVGHGRNVKFLGRRRIVYNHSILRNYYIARNHFYLAQKYPHEYSLLKTRLKEIEARILIILFEDNKLKKLHARRIGCRDASINRMGECTWL